MFKLGKEFKTSNNSIQGETLCNTDYERVNVNKKYFDSIGDAMN